ncbi:hypothetical protein J7438_09780 [Thalassotalea sp. G20_0]|uniref:hypothetical protein n=1 Tax=Thalassotalea sp. G20_0 TaxID=2821093 RepID=UPI001AD97E47|nr:hypothetical protein [Thalassotalea sp. G20_0]MBO9494371.1 hypothetical protein [Thalassotalea sp. G20_0]
MDIPACSDSHAISCCLQDTASSGSGTSGQLFFREIAEAANILCAMGTHKTNEHHLQQPTKSFHKALNDSRFENRSIVIAYSDTEEDQPLHLPVKTGSQNNDPAPVYIPENERFSIYSLLGLGDEIHSSDDLAQARVDESDERCSLPIEHEKEPREARTDAQRRRERYKNDPSYAEQIRKKSRERYRNDPAYAERQRKRQRDRKRERYHNDPVYAEHKRELKRKLRRNPVYAELERKKNRERYQNNPVYRERLRERQRESRMLRYHNDPDFAERRREASRKCRLRKAQKNASPE